jgi:hypothetical protein
MREKLRNDLWLPQSEWHGVGLKSAGWLMPSDFWRIFFPTYFFLLEDLDVGLPRRMERTSFKR